MTAIRKPTRRVATAIALAAGAAIALSACGSGQVSQTAVQQAAVNGNSADLGEIALRNVHIAYPRPRSTASSRAATPCSRSPS